MDLEHPSITKTLKEGYPDGAGKPQYKNYIQDKYNTNNFIRIYERKRKEGKDPIESYTYASGKLAFDANGDFELLQELYFHFINDDLEDFQDELKRSEGLFK